MDELLISYNPDKKKKIVGTVIAIYLACFCGYFSIHEAINNRFDILFFTALIGLVLSITLVLIYVFSTPKPVFRVNINQIDFNPPHQKGMATEWININQVSFGPSYVIFKINGGKKELKIDLSYVLYKDVKDIKAKIIELCEYKNIPYSND